MNLSALVRWWLLGSAGIVAALFTYEFAPVLIPVVIVAVGFGGIAWGMVAFARSLERKRGG